MSETWYHWALREIRASKKRLDPVDHAFLIEVEQNILAGKKMGEDLDHYLLELVNKHTEITRSPKRLGP